MEIRQHLVAELNRNKIKRKLVSVTFPKNSYIGTAAISDLKTTDIILAQRKRSVNSSNVSAVIASNCNTDGILTLTTDIPSTSAALTMDVYVIYGPSID